MRLQAPYAAGQGKHNGKTDMCTSRKVQLDASSWRLTQQLCVACSLLLPPLLQAEPSPLLGRLLLSIQQRQLLDGGRPALAVLEPDLLSAGRGGNESRTGARRISADTATSLRFDGYCQQSSGTSVWINGEEFHAGQGGPQGIQIIGVNSRSQVGLRAGRRLLQMGVGDVFHPSSGRIDVLASYQSGTFVKD